MFKGFRDFLLRGNIVDLAVAVVIGTAFTALVKSFTDNFITPLLNAFGSSESGAGWGPSIRHGSAAIEKATHIGIGDFIGAVINFVIIAAVVYFFVVLPVNKLLELRKRGQIEEVQATPEDIALLQEIRDLLAQRRP